MTAATLDLAAEWNEDFCKTLTFTDNSGNALDLTGWSFHAEVRTAAGASGTPAVDIPLTANLGITGVSVLDAKAGQIQLTIKASAWSTPAAATPMAVQSLAWELQAVTSTGLTLNLIRGGFYLQPGTVQ